MNFELSAEQKLVLESVSSFMKRESPLTRLRPLREDPLGWSRAIWKQMGELGWLGILAPEAAGGSASTFVDAAIILEELGVGLSPEPFLSSVILAGTTLARAGSSAQQERFLAPMVAGDKTLALGYAETDSRFSHTHMATRAEKTARGYRLFGKKTFVLDGHAADAIVVAARTSGAVADEGGISLFVLTPEDQGLGIKRVPTMDGHPAAHLVLEGVEVPADRRLGDEGAAGALLGETLDLGAAAACAEGIGIMRAVLKMTLEYLRTREQFGRRIGSFQALQHRAVDMFVETELARSISIMASIAVGETSVVHRRRAVSAAKAHVAASGRFVTQQAIQLHGGIGITDEHDVGLYFKRMHVLNTLFGDEDFHVARFGKLETFAPVS